ncbi:dna-mediated transposase, partial [Lasius niger]
MSNLQIPKLLLSNKLLTLEKQDKNANSIVVSIKNRFDLSAEQWNILEKQLDTSFIPVFKSKLNKVCNNVDRFRKMNADWLSTDFNFVFEKVGKRGRPTAAFDDSSKSTKFRKIQSLVDSYSAEEIRKAFFKSLKSTGKKHLIKPIKNICSDTDERTDEENIIPFNEDEALALIEDIKLSKWQYDTLRKRVEAKNVHIFMTYKSLSSARKRCYPETTSILITEKCVSVNLQDLLNHTCSRIMQMEDVLAALTKSKTQRNLILTSKWGCDGASDQSQYKQKFEDGTTSDESIFMTSMVPLTLELNDAHGRTVLWRNPQPGSTRYCRPIKFEYAKETAENSVAEVDDMEAKIKALIPTEIKTTCGKFKIDHDMELTMIDGKVCQHITGVASSASCTIYGATPAEMNNLEKLSHKPETEKNFRYGLLTLHAWIRFMECILHIAYRLEFQKWSARTNEQKEQMEKAKERIQKKFRTRIGLLIDYPKQGSGNSNDGNTAKRIFRD